MADPNWFACLQFSPAARNTLSVIEGHFQLNLFSPKKFDSTRIALNDGRLYQYMRIMYPRWTSYRLETLLLIGAAMNVGAHLNFKFWQTLESLCALNEQESTRFCELHTTRMLAFARGAYNNVKEGEGYPLDFQNLETADLRRSAVEILREQKDNDAIKQWPEDDLDDVGHEIDQRRASWRRCPIERADYWDDVERCGQGLPNFPNHIAIAPIHDDVPSKSKEAKSKLSNSSLSLLPRPHDPNATAIGEMLENKVSPMDLKSSKKRAAASHSTPQTTNKRTKRASTAGSRKAKGVEVVERAVSDDMQGPRSRHSPDGTIDDETNFPQTPKVTRAVTRSQNRPLHFDLDTSRVASESLEDVPVTSSKAATTSTNLQKLGSRKKNKQKHEEDKEAPRKRKATPGRPHLPPLALWHSSPRAALLASSPEKQAPVAVSVHSFREDSSPSYPSTGPQRTLDYSGDQGGVTRMELPAYVPGSGTNRDRPAMAQNASPLLKVSSRSDNAWNVTTNEMIFSNSDRNLTSRTRLPLRERGILPRESNGGAEVVVGEGRVISMGGLRNDQMHVEEESASVKYFDASPDRRRNAKKA